jgi:hypothetical protein
MQVNCAKCAQPIALTDIIESHHGQLSHVDCNRPHVLTPEERALVYLYCSDHTVARCPACDVSYRYTELAQTSWAGAVRTCALGVVGTSLKPFALISSAASRCPCT